MLIPIHLFVCHKSWIHFDWRKKFISAWTNSTIVTIPIDPDINFLQQIVNYYQECFAATDKQTNMDTHPCQQD